jgi:hypothetical protein
LHIESPKATISKFYAYQGGIFYVEKGATVEFVSGVTFKYSQAYEGAIAYAHDRARIIAYDNIEIAYNKVFKRGLFSVSGGSQIYLEDA